MHMDGALLALQYFVMQLVKSLKFERNRGYLGYPREFYRDVLPQLTTGLQL